MRIIKNPIFTFIIGLIIAGSIGVIAATYNAKQITYTPSDNSWDVNNVNSALDSIKQDKNMEIDNLNSELNKYKTVSFTFSSYASSTANTASAVTLSTTKYKYFKITKLTKGNSVNNCSVYAWSLTQNKDIELSLNTKYQIHNSSDGYNFSAFSMHTSLLQNGGWDSCVATLEFSND